MRIYLSGPMTGLPDKNIPTFTRYARMLREIGYEVVNPAEIGADIPSSAECERCGGSGIVKVRWVNYHIDNEMEEEDCPTCKGAGRVGGTTDWQQYLRMDIKALCDCDTLAYMPGWEHSDGAQLEIHLAHRLGLRIVSVESLLEARVQ